MVNILRVKYRQVPQNEKMETGDDDDKREMMILTFKKDNIFLSSRSVLTILEYHNQQRQAYS